MSEHKEKLMKMLRSFNQEDIQQGLSLLDALNLPSEDRTQILDFSNRKLAIDISNANLCDANFSNAVLYGEWSSCDVSRCNFTGAWIAIKNLSSCNLQNINCEGAIITDETCFEEKDKLPVHVQSQIHAFYPVLKLNRGVAMVEEAIDAMGGTWEPSYIDTFLQTPTGLHYQKLTAYMDSMKNATSVSNLQKRHSSRLLDQIVGQLPVILRENDLYLSGQFDDEGGYYFGNLHLGPSWANKNSYSSTDTTLLVITYEYFYVNFEWKRLENESEEDLWEFIMWLYERDEFGLPFVYTDEWEDEIKKISEWSADEKQKFEAAFVENWEVGLVDELHELVSSAYPNYIGGEWIWTSWERIKNNM